MFGKLLNERQLLYDDLKVATCTLRVAIFHWFSGWRKDTDKAVVQRVLATQQDS